MIGYMLYYDENKLELKIKGIKENNVFSYLNFEEEVKFYNDCYYYSSDRKSLKEFALNMKQEWENKLRNKLDKIQNLKV